MNCWSQLPWFVEFGDGVGIHDVLEDDAVVDLKKAKRMYNYNLSTAKLGFKELFGHHKKVP